jgi:hypothetical protein
MTASIARLRIKLDDVEPAVVRRVEVPLTIAWIVCTLCCRQLWAG